MIKPATIWKPSFPEESLPATLNSSEWKKKKLNDLEHFLDYIPLNVWPRLRRFIWMKWEIALTLSLAPNPKETLQVYKCLFILFPQFPLSLGGCNHLYFLICDEANIYVMKFKKKLIRVFSHHFADYEAQTAPMNFR